MSKFKSIKGQLDIIKRGTEEILPENQLVKKIEDSLANNIPLNIKLGCDPSRPDLHLGHSVVLKKLRDFQDLGHNVTLVIGDFTAILETTFLGEQMQQSSNFLDYYDGVDGFDDEKDEK